MRNCARKLKNTVNLQKKTTTSPETTASPRTTKRAKELRTPPNKSRINPKQITEKLTSPNKTRNERWKNANSPNKTQTNNERRLHQHTTTQNFENLQELTLWMGANFTRPHGGRLMILPVDRNVGNCLVKGSTCAPLRTSVPLRDPPQEPAKKQSDAAATDRTPTPKSVTVSPNTKRTRTVQILSHSKLYNSQA